ncbi:Starch-binding associating with outer membrane [Tangfeifania diversioriginum]|uniref:Starch-binding associating with outer membrane n=1 Tax=Tangfeifania diversioriginum TaxID=1168035 RepID=A0A1M6C6T0_9BACT|nr:RagB/SusD family nutrient uptake outer membrane protein [Tangfeifania diversioriginum]SHI56418.1 Starch-binding associating with outer membrane [Tangfeifania diversioriginum]
MKKILNILLLGTLTGCLLVTFSCSEDFLEKEPPGAAAGSVMESPEGVEALLIGAYSNLNGTDANRSDFGGAMATDWTYGSGASDDCYKGTSSGDQNDFNYVERYSALPSNLYMEVRWRDCFDGVSRSNQVMDFLWATQEGENPIEANRATVIEAEAKFLRAWYHFKATRVFWKIPYIKTQSELGEILPEEVPNDTEGWDEIEADLQFAIDNLPETSPLGEPGRSTKYAAMAVKAHAHLYQNELDLAKPLLDAIINSGKYDLVDNYYDNYDQSTENNEESIFEIQASSSGSSQTALLMAGPCMPQAGPAGIGWGFYQPSQNLYDAFQVTEDGLPVLDVEDRVHLAIDMGIPSSDEFQPTDKPLDPRLDWTVARRGVDFLGWGIMEGQSWIREQPNGGPFMTKKFMHAFKNQSLNVNGSGFRNGQNFRAYRYGHVLLWRAEIAIEDNDLNYARELVNMIRERAKGSDVVMGKVSNTKFDGSPIVVDWDQPAANYLIEPYPVGAEAFSSQENARKAVRLEQRLEFATEGMRFFDLRRWGIDDEVLNAFIEQDTKFRDFLKGASYNPDRADYWPLPESQLDLQDVLQQDPDYE